MAAPPQTVREWLALTEFVVPESGDVIVTVVRAGILAGRLSAFEEVGVRDPVPLGDGVHGLLGTITIETATGPVLMRLPQVIGGWAAECCAAAQRGTKPFPARVRFRALETDVEVSFVGHEPKTMAPVDGLVVFVDESGNTGDAAIASGDRLAGDQPSFALVGLGEEDGSETLDRIMKELRARHRIQAAEIKSRAMDRRPELVIDLVQAVHDAGLPLFVELMDKAYFVATNVVSYVLDGPWLPLMSAEGRMVANVLADVLTEHVGEGALIAYAAFARCPSAEAFGDFERIFRQAVVTARSSTRDGDLAQILTQIAEVFDASIGACKSDGGYARLLPPPDRSRSGKLVAMLPHISAFTNLYGRVNLFSSGTNNVRILHDELAHVANTLRGYATSLEANTYLQELLDLMPPDLADWEFTPGRFQLDFVTSDKHPGIQAADILARFLTRRMNAAMTGRAVDGDPVVHLLLKMNEPSRGVGVNIVSTSQRNNLFWGRALSDGSSL